MFPAMYRSSSCGCNSGVLSQSNLTSSSVTINWTKADDLESALANIQYLVYYSVADNLNTVTNIETFGTPFGNYENDNKSRCVLTLKGVTIKDKNNNELPKIKFNYSSYNPDIRPHRVKNPNNGVDVLFEKKDCWGYYHPKSTFDWNVTEKKEDALNNNGIAYASAWSLEKITLPSGMSIKLRRRFPDYGKNS